MLFRFVRCEVHQTFCSSALRPQFILTLQLPVTIFICSQIFQSQWEDLHNLWLFALFSDNLTLEKILKMHSGKALMLHVPFYYFSKEWTLGKRIWASKRYQHICFLVNSLHWLVIEYKLQEEGIAANLSCWSYHVKTPFFKDV